MAQNNMFEDLALKGTLFAGIGAMLASWFQKYKAAENPEEAALSNTDKPAPQAEGKKEVTSDMLEQSDDINLNDIKLGSVGTTNKAPEKVPEKSTDLEINR